MVFGLAAYMFGRQFDDIRGSMSILGIVLAVIVGFWFARRYEAELEAKTERWSDSGIAGDAPLARPKSG